MFRKGKKDVLKATALQSKHYKQKAKRIISFLKIGQTTVEIATLSETCLAEEGL